MHTNINLFHTAKLKLSNPWEECFMPRIGKMSSHIRGRTKRILYKLRKKGNCYLYDFIFDGDKQIEKRRARDILDGLIKKGLVTSDKVSLRGSVSRAYYWLTDEGEKVADEIAKQVDEYKSW